MKRLLLLVLAALALPTAVEANWFGKYGSYREAKEACNEWSIKGGEAFHQSTPTRFQEYNLETDIRTCVKEEETNQLLGLEKINIKSRNYNWGEWVDIENPYNKKIKKRFKY